jgi:glycosyltransferase involved in cell wall biosynthesis
MLSILIPTYNYNAFDLAENLEKQALKAGIVFELICVDDGSFSTLNVENQKINSLANCKFIESRKNIGRTANRQFLAEQAQYDWLLFLDSDVNPKLPNFLEVYIEKIASGSDAYFGGFAYPETLENPKQSLRYHFGKHREEISATKRNSNPYKVIISANFLIKKKTFLQINGNIDRNSYGLDYLFGSLLKQHDVPIEHIDNSVYHLGMDDNDVYLKKTKKAVETLAVLHKNKTISSNAISLLKAFKFLNMIGLSFVFGKLLLAFNSDLESNLSSAEPSLFLFDMYRLGYFCRIY